MSRALERGRFTFHYNHVRDLRHVTHMHKPRHTPWGMGASISTNWRIFFFNLYIYIHIDFMYLCGLCSQVFAYIRIHAPRGENGASISTIRHIYTCICMYSFGVCIHIYAHTHTHPPSVCMHVFGACMHVFGACMHVFAYIRIHKCTFVCTYMDVFAYILWCTYACICVCLRIGAYNHVLLVESVIAHTMRVRQVRQ